jgi:hypothetical protein
VHTVEDDGVHQTTVKGAPTVAVVGTVIEVPPDVELQFERVTPLALNSFVEL